MCYFFPFSGEKGVSLGFLQLVCGTPVAGSDELVLVLENHQGFNKDTFQIKAQTLMPTPHGFDLLPFVPIHVFLVILSPKVAILVSNVSSIRRATLCSVGAMFFFLVVFHKCKNKITLLSENNTIEMSSRHLESICVLVELDVFLSSFCSVALQQF